MSSNPNYKPSEGKREEFRKYLEKTGVMDALTKILVSLYEEVDKPENAIEYICNKLANQFCGETLDSLREQLEEAKNKITELEQENLALKGTEAGNEVGAKEVSVEGETEAATAPAGQDVESDPTPTAAD